MTANKLIFGITGGSGVGKGYVGEAFKKYGVAVFDADIIAREVTMPDGEAYGELMEAFGREYFDENGYLDRKKLARLVFSDKAKLGILNDITHKHIKTRLTNRLKGTKVGAIDGAVIIGSPVEDMCEFLVGVTAPDEVRLKRILERDGIDEALARARIAAQPNSDFYKKHCRYIIENDGKCDIDCRVREILEEIKEH